MNNIANEQLFELGVLFVAAIIYVVAYFICSGLAILISNRKSGVIRSFLQGVLLVGLLAIAEVLFFNGKIKIYHILTYFILVYAFIKGIDYCTRKIKSTQEHKKEKINSTKKIS